MFAKKTRLKICLQRRLAKLTYTQTGHRQQAYKGSVHKVDTFIKKTSILDIHTDKTQTEHIERQGMQTRHIPHRRDI